MFFRNIISPSGTWSWKSTNIQFWSKLRTLGAPYWWCGVWCVHVEMTKLCPCFGSNMWPLSNPNSDHTELLHVVLLHSSFSRMLSIFVRLFQKRCIEFRTVFCELCIFWFHSTSYKLWGNLRTPPRGMVHCQIRVPQVPWVCPWTPWYRRPC